MAPKKYTLERLNEIAVDSATKMKGLLQSGHLTCEYICDKDNTITKSDLLSFRWYVESSGYNDTYEVTARCNHVVERGIPFPDRWRTALKCLKLHDQVRECTGNVMEFGASNVKCELLGQAKIQCDDRIGKTVALNNNGSRVVYLLCGHVENDEWMLHNGSYIDNELDSNPFQEKDLICKNIVADAWDVTQSKRLRSNNHMKTLRGYVQVNDYLWSEIVAVARFRAEEMRSERQSREFNEERAKHDFESNPFLWESSGKRNSHVRLTTLWTWKRGKTYRKLEHVDLHNLISRGPAIPRELKQSDDNLLQRLLSIAELETKESKSPCRYLGMKVSEDRYERDPSLWGTTSKNYIHVWFEWPHVKHNWVTHKACCSMNHLVNHGRRVPLNPLKNTCPSGLVFDIELFEIIAKNVHEKIEFKGVAFEGDCNNILYQLPNDGKDAQEEPVYWVPRGFTTRDSRLRPCAITTRPGSRRATARRAIACWLPTRRDSMLAADTTR